MLFFTILRSKSGCCYIYDKDGIKFDYCDSMNDVFDYFYSWCEELGCHSVIYSQTSDKNVIRVKMD